MKLSTTSGLFLLTFVVVVVVVVALASSASANDNVETQQKPDEVQEFGRANFKWSKIFDFDNYKRTYHKIYNNLAEESRRSKLFFVRAWKVFISAVNYLRGKDTKYLKLNDMSDWTPEERDQMTNTNNHHVSGQSSESDGLPADEVKEIKKKLSEIVDQQDVSEKGQELKRIKRGSGGFFSKIKDNWYATNRDVADPNQPDQVFLDLRSTGCITPVRFQGKCGCCYAFAGIVWYEYHYCRQTGQLLSFSEQFLVDCGRSSMEGGCRNGGYDKTVTRFVEKYGLELDSDYPYEARENQCPYSRSKDSKRMGFIKPTHQKVKRLKSFDRHEIAQALESYGPLNMGFYRNDNFLDYGGGVDRLENCRSEGGHRMSIIGHGREDGLEYWLIKNSFGAHWGENGYYKLSKGVASRCWKEISYLEVSLETNPRHDRDFVQRLIRERA